MIVVNLRVNVFRSWCQTVRRLEAYTLARMPQSLPSYFGHRPSKSICGGESWRIRWTRTNTPPTMTGRANTQERGHVIIPSQRLADLKQRSNARNRVSNTWHPASSEAGMKGDNNFLSEPLVQYAASDRVISCRWYKSTQNVVDARRVRWTVEQESRRQRCDDGKHDNRDHKTALHTLVSLYVILFLLSVRRGPRPAPSPQWREALVLAFSIHLPLGCS
jgi:hypothetical protein